LLYKRGQVALVKVSDASSDVSADRVGFQR
jgi:hypothetical protein